MMASNNQAIIMQKGTLLPKLKNQKAGRVNYQFKVEAFCLFPKVFSREKA
jgi:hypothetical protein